MKKRIWYLLALLLPMVAMTAQAEGVSFNVCSWDDVNKKVVTKVETRDCTPIEGQHWDWVPLGDKDKETWYVVKGEDVQRKVLVIFGTVHLVLTDHCRLTCNHVKLEAQNNAVLHIHCQSTTFSGSLNVINQDLDGKCEYKEAAAIGGGKERSSGSLYVHGGFIKTRQRTDDYFFHKTTGVSGAGIGGGKYRGIDANHRVVIYEGELDIEGGDEAAGIGGGYKGAQGGPVYIYGGTVTAWSYGTDGAGIGGGYNRDGGEVHIHGGDVKAYGSRFGAAIGGSKGGKGGTLEVTGGKLYAQSWDANSGYVGPAIGGGSSGKGGTVTIKGGTVTVTKDSTSFLNNVALIGGSDDHQNAQDRGSLEIASGLKVSYKNDVTAPLTLVNSANDRVKVLHIETNNIKAVIEPCNHGGGTATYTQIDHNQHRIVCKACGYESIEDHKYNTAGMCACGRNAETLPECYYVSVYKTTDGKTYAEGEKQTVVQGKEYMLPVPEPKEGLIFMGWLQEKSADGIEMKDNEIGSLRDGGEVVTLNGDLTLYARYRYDYTEEWTWENDCTKATVKVSNAILNDSQTLTATVMEDEEKRVEPTAKTPGERCFYATASMTRGTGVTYQFTDNESLVFYSDINPKVTLDVQSKDSANTKTLTEYFGMKADVTINNLTIVKDKKIHPICLPFYVSKNDNTPLKGAIIYELAGTQLRNHEFAMTFKKVEGVKPGVPSFYRFDMLSANVQNPVFENVIIEELSGSVAEKEYTSTMWSADDETVELWGTFEPEAIEEEIRELYFVMDGDGISLRPDTLKAFSSYFYIACPTDEQGNSKVHSVWLGFEEDDAYRFSKRVTHSWDGNGSEATPYIINTAEQLNEMADAFNAGYPDVAGKYFKQGANITFDKSIENNFTPIRIFNGNYNGDGHVISGVNIKKTGNDNAALFLELADDSRVRNVIVKNSLFKGSMAAAICCELTSKARILNCHVLKDVTITANDSCAGTFAAYMAKEMGNISKCTSQATVEAPNSYAGGIAGIMDSGIIGRCIYIGNAVHSKPGNNSYAISMLDMYKDGMFNDHCYYTDASFTHERDIEGARSTLMPHIDYDNTTFLSLLHERDEYLLQAGLKEEDICYDLTINGRDFKATQQADGTWKSMASTISLPFDMAIPENQLEDVKVYKFHEVDEDNKVFQFTNDFPILKAGEAYIVVIEKGSLTFTGKDVLVKEVPMEPTIVKNADASKEMGYWCATFNKLTNEELVEHKAYVIQKNGTFRLYEKIYASRPYISPFRAYFSPLEPTMSSVYQIKFIRTENGEEVGEVVDFPADQFDFDFDLDDETGIDMMSDVRSKMEDAWYDLQGRKLSGKPNKGIYIQNGKKIIIK